MDNDIDESSGSDFDDDEDPDKIQVPGETCILKNLLNFIIYLLFAKVVEKIWLQLQVFLNREEVNRSKELPMSNPCR